MENFNPLHLNPHYHHQQLHLPATEIMSRNHPELRPRYQQQDTPVEHSNQMVPQDPEDGMPGASDFVRKLFRYVRIPFYLDFIIISHTL